ncbi:MAG: PilZ domain-containing protein [Nitrospirae bacterium]|nr:PilZ domain-containing protein [Nitrospirota bacterium]
MADMKMRHVKMGDVQVGKPLRMPIYDESGQLMLGKGHVVTEKDILNSITKGIIIDMEEVERPEEAGQELEADIIPIEDTPFDTLDLAKMTLSGLFRNLRTERDFNSKIAAICRSLEEVCKIDEDLALGTILLEQSQRYPIVHQMHTAIVCEIVSKRLGWSMGERASLLSAALTMNISMIDLQEMLQGQGQTLTNNQRASVGAHPIVSATMLRNLSVTDTVWLEAVLQHHESIDGTGYPYGLKSDDICHAARLLSLADVYCARVAGRRYRPALSPIQAMKDIYLSKGHKVDTELAMTFIKTIGMFPPGMFVRLKNDEIAIVTHRGEKTDKPLVRTILRANDFPPLSPLRRDTDIDEFSITAVLPASKIRVDVNRYQLWGYGVFKKSRTNKRKHRRIKLNLPVKILDVQPVNVTDATMLNISESGCLLKLLWKADRQFTLNKSYYATFRLMDKTIENIVCKVRNVKLSNEDHLLGMEFTHPDQESFEHIKYFISLSRKDVL